MKRLTASELSKHEDGYFRWIDEETHDIKVIVFENGKREDYCCDNKESFNVLREELDRR